jgi:hypothetical protein
MKLNMQFTYELQVSPTHLMSKYLALLALPPPLKKLRAIWEFAHSNGRCQRGIKI